MGVRVEDPIPDVERGPFNAAIVLPAAVSDPDGIEQRRLARGGTGRDEERQDQDGDERLRATPAKLSRTVEGQF
jgi:hypothetical protein